MQPDKHSVAVLVDALRSALHGSDAWDEVDRKMLAAFAYSKSENSDDKPSPRGGPHGYRAKSPGRVARHYVIAEVTTTMMSEGDFPVAMTCAAHLRSRISVAEQIELAVLIVGPRGGERDPLWSGAVRRFEANDSIARVLVWTPPEADVAQLDSVQRFTSRLLSVALPDVDAVTLNLSPLEEIFRDSLLARDAQQAWRRVLLDAQLQPKERAGRLLEHVVPDSGDS